ncbi:MAG TPA: hypothetical protein VMV57_13640 [Terracidiphilus sp.]|nr:hypothetical protein [Terracidiphilus sp.]
MKKLKQARRWRDMWPGGVLAGLGMVAAVLMMGSLTARAQEPTAKAPNSIPAGETYAVIPLKNIKNNQEGNDVMTALRNMLGRARIYYVYTQNAVAIRGTQADLDVARKMLAELDKSPKSYRLTYTLTLRDGGKTVDTRRFMLLVEEGDRMELKRGERVPIVTGTDAKSAMSPEVQYVDIGVSISAMLDGGRLRSKVEETSMAETKSSLGLQDPVIHQTVLQQVVPLVVGKPLLVGTLDLPNSTRQEEVTVTAELME